MKTYFSSLLLMLALLVIAPPVHPQEKLFKPQSNNRPVVIKTREGRSISGNFLDANDTTLRVEDSTGTRTIDLNDVITITFRRESPKKRQASQSRVSDRTAAYNSRTYITGPRGGCYYINSNGNKTYVDRSLCGSPTNGQSTSTGYIRGPRGGCYYINSNGNKTYVNRSLCN